MVSRKHMQGLQHPPAALAELKAHPQLQLFLSQLRAAGTAASAEGLVMEFADKLVPLIYLREGVPLFGTETGNVTRQTAYLKSKADALRFAVKGLFTSSLMADNLEQLITDVAVAAVALSKQPMGIGYEKDVVCSMSC